MCFKKVLQETPKALFYMANDTVKQEVEAALKESHLLDAANRYGLPFKTIGAALVAARLH